MTFTKETFRLSATVYFYKYINNQTSEFNWLQLNPPPDTKKTTNGLSSNHKSMNETPCHLSHSEYTLVGMGH